MSVQPYTKNVFTSVSPTAVSFRRRQTGVYATGSSRSRPHPYALSEGRVESWRYQDTGEVYHFPTDPTNRSGVHDRRMPFTGSAWQAGRNKAYGNLLKAVNSEQAAIGTAMAEWRESFGMIANRSMGLYRAMKKLRKGDFRGFLKELSVSPKRKHRSRTGAAAHEVSGLWLEYWFGWSPSINDIYTACQQTSEPLPSGRYYGSARSHFEDKRGPDTLAGEWRCRTGATFKLQNPNLYLASQLGLTNLASVAWEVTPFSFLVDWCFDVSSYIGSFSDFMGLEVTDEWATEVLRTHWTRSSSGPQFTGVYRASQVFMVRQTDLIRPLPNFDVLANLGVSKTRAASAMALLTQIFGSVR